MPTLSDFAGQYASYLRQHGFSETTVEAVADKIKGLTYTNTGKPLSEPDIDQIVDEIQRIITGRKELPGGGILHEAEDSTNFIKMIQLIRREAKRR